MPIFNFKCDDCSLWKSNVYIKATTDENLAEIVCDKCGKQMRKDYNMSLFRFRIPTHRKDELSTEEKRLISKDMNRNERNKK